MNHQQFPDRSDKTGAPKMPENTSNGPSKKVSLPSHIAGKVTGIALGILSAAGIAGCEQHEKPLHPQIQYTNMHNDPESVHAMYPDILAMTEGTEWKFQDFTSKIPSDTSFMPAAVPIYVAKALMEKPEIYGHKKSNHMYWTALEDKALTLLSKDETSFIYLNPGTKQIMWIWSHRKTGSEMPEEVNAQFHGKQVTREVLDQVTTAIKVHFEKKQKDAQLREENKKKFEPLARENDFFPYGDDSWSKFIHTDEIGRKDWFYLEGDLDSMISQNIILSSDGGRIDKVSLRIEQRKTKAEREEADRNEAEMVKKYGDKWKYEKTTRDIPEDEWQKALELEGGRYFRHEIIEVPGFEGQEITPELIKKIHAATIKAAKEYITKKRLELRDKRH